MSQGIYQHNHFWTLRIIKHNRHRTFRSRKRSFHALNLMCLKTFICTSQNLLAREEGIITPVFWKGKIRLLQAYQGSIRGKNGACWEDFSHIQGLHCSSDLLYWVTKLSSDFRGLFHIKCTRLPSFVTLQFISFQYLKKRGEGKSM